MRVADIDTLVLCGGGLLGVSYIGALETLYRTVGFDFFSPKRFLRRFIGVSIGSVLSLVLVLGLRHKDELRKTYYPLLLGDKSMGAVMDPNPVTFVKSWGADDGATVRRMLKEVLRRRGCSPSITFEELLGHTGASLTVCVTNVTSGRTEYMSPHTTPGMQVVTAIMMSIALPPFFAPVRHPETDDLYVDGCLLQSLPVCVDPKGPSPTVVPSQTLVLRLGSSPPTPVTSLSTYMGRIISLLLTANAAKESVPKDLPTLTVHNTDRTPFNFEMSKRSGSKLLLCGVESAERFLKEHDIEPFEPTRSVGVQTDPIETWGRKHRSKKGDASKKLRALPPKKKKRRPDPPPGTSS